MQFFWGVRWNRLEIWEHNGFIIGYLIKFDYYIGK